MLLLAMIALGAGLFFKVAAVPFHHVGAGRLRGCADFSDGISLDRIERPRAFAVVCDVSS
jgi:hypothetical protein